MNINDEKITRKIDNLGRVSLPKSMRDKLGINAGDEVKFYLISPTDEEHYIACKKPDSSADLDRYKIAAQVLTELGYDVPEELQ